MSRWTKLPAGHEVPPKKNAISAAAETGASPADAFYRFTRPVWDPYWFWAELTEWQGFKRLGRWESKENQSVRVLLHDMSEGRDAIARAMQGAGAKVDPMYLTATTKPRFVTGDLPVESLDGLAAVEGIEFELGAPLNDQGSDLLGDAKGYYGQETELNIPFADSVLVGVPAEAFETSWDSGVGTIAVFDYGCPFLRDEYAGVGPGAPTRIRALWHQEVVGEQFSWGDAPTPEPGAPPAFEPVPYGRQMRWGLLEAIRDGVLNADVGLDEAQLYHALNYLVDYDDPRRRVFASTHGAHVLDVVGGRVDPLGSNADPDPDPDPEPEPDPQPRPESEPASKAGLIFVHMPEATAGDSAGGSLSVYLLDALRYCLNNAEKNLPLVVNVSYGSTAGPHDGSSMIEQAMDEMFDENERLAIVLAAGNSRRLGLHTSRTVSSLHTALFRIEMAAGDHTDSFVEFWYPTEHADWLEYRARIPDGDWSEWVGRDSHAELRSRDVDGRLIATLVHRQAVPNGGRPTTGENRSMVLLALRPTEAPDDDDGVLADAGQWEVEVRVKPAENAEEEKRTSKILAKVDGWIKRDDSRPFSGRVQSVFLGLKIGDEDDSLSSLASGANTIAVSGFRWSDGMPAGYSSEGPRYAGQWPMVYGMCEWDSVNPGIRAAAVRSRETFLMNGTSVAAPVVARRLFNLMCRKGPMSKQDLIAAFRAKTEVPGALIRMDEDPSEPRPSRSQ